MAAGPVWSVDNDVFDKLMQEERHQFCGFCVLPQDFQKTLNINFFCVSGVNKCPQVFHRGLQVGPFLLIARGHFSKSLRGEFTDECEKDPPAHAEVSSCLPHPNTKSLPQATEIHPDG